jgi:hypothetical protein
MRCDKDASVRQEKNHGHLESHTVALGIVARQRTRQCTECVKSFILTRRGTKGVKYEGDEVGAMLVHAFLLNVVASGYTTRQRLCPRRQKTSRVDVIQACRDTSPHVEEGARVDGMRLGVGLGPVHVGRDIHHRVKNMTLQTQNAGTDVCDAHRSSWFYALFVRFQSTHG